MKIGLFALSGVRAYDEELFRLGFTLPGFIERSKTIASLPSLSLITLAGITERQHQYQYQYFDIEDVRKMDSLPLGLDLVAISSFSAQIFEAYDLVDQYRAMGVPVIMGGLHVSALPEEAATHCDAVVIGEGEAHWQEVLRDAERGRLKRFYRASEETFHLNDSPIPAYELLDLSKYNRLTLQTSRGCPFHCEFCASSILLTSRYKQKPIPNVLAELNRILALWPRPFLEFADDNSFVNHRYWKELLPHLNQHKIRWFTETDLSVYEDDELLTLMCESGCVEVLIGLESPDQPSLQGLELKSDWKYRQWRHYSKAVRRIQSHGIRVNGCFVLGLDHHTPEIFDDVYRFACESEMYDVQITIQTAFPGTPLYERLRRDGRILQENRWDLCTLFDINYQPKNMSVEELRLGFRELAKQLYSEEMTNTRREVFKRKYLKPSLFQEVNE